MTNRATIRQLESLMHECIYQKSLCGSDAWDDDIIALNKSIRVFERKEARRNDMSLRFSAFICTLMLIGSIFLIIGLVGGVELNNISEGEAMFKMILYLSLLFTSYTGLKLMWLGVGNE